MVRTVAFLLAVVALAAAAALWWWTAPATAPTTELATALSAIAPLGDGALAIAQPARAGRWLFRHPEAATLIAAAAPGAVRAGRRMATPARALAQAAEGPLAVWWRGDGLALAADVDAGARQGLVEMAALRGLAAADLSGGFAIASAPDLLADRFTTATRPALPSTAPSHATAVAWTGLRVWCITAKGDTLEAVSGNLTELPTATGPSIAATSGARSLLDSAGLGRLGLGDRVVLIVDGDAWALRLGNARLPNDVERLLGVRDAHTGSTHRTQGPFGEIWWRVGDGISIATDQQLLEALDSVGPGEYGFFRGAEVARALARLSRMLEPLPGFAARASALSATARTFQGLDTARWRITPEGGTIVMEW